MASDMAKVRDYVVQLLKKNKTLTEREVKAAIGKAFKVNPKEVGAAVIRDVRKAMGIDRPGALAHARAMLSKEPLIEAKKVIKAVKDQFGIRLGPPDVSRMRPKKARAQRKGRKPGRPSKTALAVAGAPARRGRKPGRPAKAKAAGLVLRRKPGRPLRGLNFGEISITFDGKGLPAALADFFRSLKA
jgi:ribosomal protein L23